MGLGRARDGLAPTPPMGWNSWNHFGANIDERLITETAEAMVKSGMRDAGYRYVVVDDAWHAARRDEHGDLVPDPVRFPSGMKALADHVHGLGLRFGIYTDAGAKTCQGWPGSLGYEFRDARRFAEWGCDYVKIDWCHTDGLPARALYEKWCLAIQDAGRPMVYSICEWGRHRPWEWARGVGHLWRTCWDIQDRWSSVLDILDRQQDLHPYAGPDGWNDPDMLEVGNGGMSEAEYRSHFSLWAMLAAPLMAGNDLRDMSDETRAILTAPEVIAIDQDPRGKQGRRLGRDSDGEVWIRELEEPDARAVLLFARGDAPARLRIDWTDLGWPADATVAVRDLWLRRELGAFVGGFEATVEPHDVALLRVAR